MTTINGSIIQSGDGNSASGINLGQMIGSTLHAMSETRDQTFRQAEPAIRRFLETLRNDTVLPEVERRQVVDAAAEAATQKDPAKVKSKLSLLKTLVKGLINAPSVADKLMADGHHLIGTLTDLVG